MLDRAAEAKPCGQRDAACGQEWDVREIEDDQSESPAFEQEISGAQNLLEAVLGSTEFIFYPPFTVKIACGLRRTPISAGRSCRGRGIFPGGAFLRVLASPRGLFIATHPEHTIQIHPGGRKRVGIERIAGVDEGAAFSATGGGGEGGEEHRGAA